MIRAVVAAAAAAVLVAERLIPVANAVPISSLDGHSSGVEPWTRARTVDGAHHVGSGSSARARTTKGSAIHSSARGAEDDVLLWGPSWSQIPPRITLRGAAIPSALSSSSNGNGASSATPAVIARQPHDSGHGHVLPSTSVAPSTRVEASNDLAVLEGSYEAESPELHEAPRAEPFDIWENYAEIPRAIEPFPGLPNTGGEHPRMPRSGTRSGTRMFVPFIVERIHLTCSRERNTEQHKAPTCVLGFTATLFTHYHSHYLHHYGNRTLHYHVAYQRARVTFSQTRKARCG